MKRVEDRLRELPSIAQNMGVDATQQLKYRIRNAARDQKSGRRQMLKKWAPVLAMALVLCIGLGAALPSFVQTKTPDPLSAQAAGENDPGAMVRSALLDVPQGSIQISASQVPAYRSIWAQGGANFPLIRVEGRTYRLLTTPAQLSGSLKGETLGIVNVFTDEPALADSEQVVSNIVAQGETVYAVSGMNGALVCAYVDGNLRVFQRVGYADSAVIGNETLQDTLKAQHVIALELSDVGTVQDSAKAMELLNLLYRNAAYQRAGGGETGQSLLIYLNNGITMQLSVNGEKLIGCGTWACPDFFEAFEAALGE
ncbi:MAG: hypothetical protein IIX10_01495 [Clostridia bacterium]|nr:hypothetical protein [Clostridia bacterium]